MLHEKKGGGDLRLRKTNKCVWYVVIVLTSLSKARELVLKSWASLVLCFCFFWGGGKSYSIVQASLLKSGCPGTHGNSSEFDPKYNFLNPGRSGVWHILGCKWNHSFWREILICVVRKYSWPSDGEHKHLKSSSARPFQVCALTHMDRCVYSSVLPSSNETRVKRTSFRSKMSELDWWSATHRQKTHLSQLHQQRVKLCSNVLKRQRNLKRIHMGFHLYIHLNGYNVYTINMSIYIWFVHFIDKSTSS